MDPSKKVKAAKHFLPAVLMRGGAILGALAISVVAARSLGPSEFGIYSFIISLITLISLPTQAGLPTLLMRETAKYYSRDDMSSLVGLWDWSQATMVRFSIAVMAASLAGCQVFSWISGRSVSQQFLLALPLIFLIPAANCRSATIRGLQYPLHGQIPESVVRPIAFIICIYIYVQLGLAITSSAAIMLFCASSFLAYMVGVIILNSKKPAAAQKNVASRADAGSWRKALLPLALIDSLQIISSHIIVVLSGIFLGQEQAGFLRVAASIASTTTLGLQAISMVAAPLIAGLHYRGQVDAVDGLAGKIAIIGLAVSVPVAIVFAFLGEQLVGLVYGPGYEAAAAPLFVLAAGYAITSAFGLGATILNMSGNERNSARALAASVGANIVIAVPLMYLLGLAGAAASIAISMVLFSALVWYQTIHKLGVDITPWSVTLRRLRGAGAA